MRRRDFIKAGFVLAGGLWLPRKAFPWWHLAGGKSYPYKTWEDDNSNANDYACIFDGGDAESEYGQGGGLAGDDLRLKSEGNPAGSRGTDPPYRPMDGNDDTFHGTNAAFETLIADGSGTWTIFIFFNDIGDSGNARYIFWAIAEFVIATMSYDSELRLTKDVNDKLNVLVTEGGNQETATTNSALPSGKVILGAWADNVNPVRCGFVSGDEGPSNWSDFNVNNRAEIASNKGAWANWDGGDGADEDFWIAYSVVARLICDIATIKISKNCLIDNAA